MRVSNFSWALCATILVASSAQADRADEPFGILDDSPRFMLYVHKEIGSTRHKSTGPSFGFAVDRTVPLTLQTDQSALRPSTARIFDVRVAPFDDGAIFLNGLQAHRRDAAGVGLQRQLRGRRELGEQSVAVVRRCASAVRSASRARPTTGRATAAAPATASGGE